MELWVIIIAIIIAAIIIIIAVKHSDRRPQGGRWLSERESRALKAAQEKASRTTTLKPTKLPPEYRSGVRLPKNRVFCLRCGMADQIFALYGGDNTRYGCDWCGLIFT